MPKIDARRDALRSDGLGGTTQGTQRYVSAEQAHDAAGTPRNSALRRKDTDRLARTIALAKVHDGVRNDGTVTRVYAALVYDRPPQGPHGQGVARGTLTEAPRKPRVEVFTYREAAQAPTPEPTPESERIVVHGYTVPKERIVIPATRIRQDRAAIEAARERMAALEARIKAREQA